MKQAAAGPTGAAVFHLHPLRRCNLECGHCYSNSSPQATDCLSLEQVSAAVRQAAVWGYERLAISGGEPLLYPWLDEVVSLGADLGMKTALITNGLLVSQRQNMDILRRIDTVAVSIDGLSASHDAMRQRPRAFASVLRALDMLRSAGIDFSIICGVSNDNLDETEELAALACQAGAQALQLHPIAAAGRARHNLTHALLGDEDATLLYVSGQLLGAEYAGRMGVHTDLVHRQTVAAHPAIIYACDHAPDPGNALPADLLGVLVLEPDGVVNPVCFGFSPFYSLGNILQQPLAGMWQPWLQSGYQRLGNLGHHLLAEIKQDAGPAVFNPSDIMCRASYQLAAKQLPASLAGRTIPIACEAPSK